MKLTLHNLFLSLTIFANTSLPAISQSLSPTEKAGYCSMERSLAVSLMTMRYGGVSESDVSQLLYDQLADAGLPEEAYRMAVPIIQLAYNSGSIPWTSRGKRLAANDFGDEVQSDCLTDPLLRRR